MQKFKNYVVPGAFTTANMLFGFLAIMKAVEGEFISAGWLIIIASIMDGLDGKIARLVDKDSRFGLEFDSLADVISFGIAPALLVYFAYFESFNFFGIIIVFLYLMCGALRLARFNIETDHVKVGMFTGLPIPVAAATISSFLHFNYYFWDEIKLHALIFPLVILLSFLMISAIPYEKAPRFSLKYEKKNLIRLSIMVGGLILVAIQPSTWFFPLCLVYIFNGVFRALILSIKKIAVQRANGIR